MLGRFAVALCGITLSVAAIAQTVAQIKDVQVPRISRPPALEDFISGGGRSDMKQIDDFRQRQPGDGVPVSQKTSAWIGYDERSFYAVFVCQVSAGQLRARLSRREDLLGEDLVGGCSDTDHDRHRGR